MDHLGDMRLRVINPIRPHQTGEGGGDFSYRAFHLHPRASIEIFRNGQILTARGADNQTSVFLQSCSTDSCNLKLIEVADADAWRMACAVFEYLFSTEPLLRLVILEGERWDAVVGDLSANGLFFFPEPSTSQLCLHADMFWQTAGLWTHAVPSYVPWREVHDGKVAHPLRAFKPKETVYARYIPALGGVLTMDVATIRDLPDIHRWMNDPRVNEFWNEAGSEEKHRRYLEGMFADPHIIPLIGRFEGRAFSYFEVYWAKEDIVGTFCDAGDYDRGCHVIVGEDTCRGRDWFTAWLPSLLHYMFLDDPRTERIVQEPSSSHHRQLRNLQRSGFSYLKSAFLPTKHAAIMSISRQRFFADRLWHPSP